MMRVRYSPRPSPSSHSCPRSLQHVRKQFHLLLPELRCDHFFADFHNVQSFQDTGWTKVTIRVKVLDPNNGQHIYFFK